MTAATATTTPINRYTKTDKQSLKAALDAAPRQVELLQYIEEYTAKAGYPPSLTEMRLFLDASSENAALGSLKMMETKGWVERPRHPHTGRAIVRTLRITDIGRKVLKAAAR